MTHEEKAREILPDCYKDSRLLRSIKERVEDYERRTFCCLHGKK